MIGPRSPHRWAGWFGRGGPLEEPFRPGGPADMCRLLHVLQHVIPSTHMRHDDYSMVWKALADPVRRQILDHLRERPWTTGDLAQAIGGSRFVTMNHLTTL